MGDVEPELNGCGHLVDMLTARTRCTDKVLLDFPFINGNMVVDADHMSLVTVHILLVAGIEKRIQNLRLQRRT